MQLRAVRAARRPHAQACATCQQPRQEHLLEQRELLRVAEQRAVRDRHRAAEPPARLVVAPQRAREPVLARHPLAPAGPLDLLVDVLAAEARPAAGPRRARAQSACRTVSSSATGENGLPT